jgi:bifunctional DNA-binding transcriptional regulator/antitoxin component of YhaV-PrlF toxin-antitoxin module
MSEKRAKRVFGGYTKVYARGQSSIPMMVRANLGIHVGDTLQWFIEGDKAIVEKVEE